MIAALALAACVYTAGPPPVRCVDPLNLSVWGNGDHLSPNSFLSTNRIDFQPTSFVISVGTDPKSVVIFKADGSIILGEHTTPCEGAKAMLEMLAPMLKLRAGACPP